MSNMKQKTEKKPRARTSTNVKKNSTAKVTKRKTQAVAKTSAPIIGNGVEPNSKKRRFTTNIKQLEQPPVVPSRKRKASVDISDQVEEIPKVQTIDKKVKLPQSISNNIGSRTAVKKQKVLLEVPKLSTVSGVLFVVGNNDVGQIGLGEAVELRKRPTELSFPSRFVDIAAGGMHSVCLTDKGEVYTFGCNDEGALGRVTEDESSEHKPEKVNISEIVVQVSAGDSHSAALTEKGHVYIWGNFRNNEGAMGLTSLGVKQLTPTRILNTVTVVSIASGNEHLVCLSNDGLVYTCGCGETGQLGRVTERSCKRGGRKGLSALLEPAVVPVSHSGRPVMVENIWTGSYSTFVKAKVSGNIYGFGLNNYNQLGFENERVRFVPKLVSSFKSQSWQRINGGQHHTLALDTAGQVYSLGRKEYGRLGLGENCEEKSSPTSIPNLEEENCIDISCGNAVSFAVTKKGSVYSWGMGTAYQLGHGNEDDCHVPKLIQGNLLNSWYAFKVSGGGQHTLILANKKATTEEKVTKMED